jgi:hypothetical protein
MRRDGTKLFPIPLTRRQKEILDRVAQASGMTRCAVFRQLLLREYRRKALARSDR